MYRGEQYEWRRARRRVGWAGGMILTLVVLVVLIRLGYAYRWTGFGQYKVNGEVQPFKTLWDWLDLLIVPIVLAIGGYLFTRTERQASETAAARRSQDTALQAYLDQMGQLLLDKDQPLRVATADSEVRTLARARTLTVLASLGGNRKVRVLQFLYEAGLITRGDSVVTLIDADLKWADLRRAKLSKTDLCAVNLYLADLRWADLRGANLRRAIVSEVDLRVANLSEADLRGVNLRGSDLRYADLSGVQGVTEEYLKLQARSLEGTTMPNGQKCEDWLKDKERRGEENSGPS